MTANPTLALNPEQRVRQRLDSQTKPPGSLGRLEALAVQMARVFGHETPQIESPQLVVFAADHGLVAQGVSAYPAEVTPQMVANMLAGGAAVSVLARQHGLALTVVDCGVAVDMPAHPQLVQAKARCGTADASLGPAMSAAERDAAIAHGAALVRRLPGNVLLLGEMGIGNTSAAALLMARLSGTPVSDCTGRGTGLGATGLAHKIAVLQRVLALHADARTPLEALAAFGGLEIATMLGAVQAAVATRRLVVVDGFITTAAVALAAALDPSVLGSCVFAHVSAESGHGRWLKALSVRPLLDLELRLGEGSGAALAWPLIVSAERLLQEMATFESAGVSGRSADAG